MKIGLLIKLKIDHDRCTAGRLQMKRRLIFERERETGKQSKGETERKRKENFRTVDVKKNVNYCEHESD